MTRMEKKFTLKKHSRPHTVSWLPPLLLILLFFYFPNPSAGLVNKSALSAEVIDRIVAVVNDDVITLFDLNQVFTPYAQKIKSMGYPETKEKEMLYQLRQDLLNQLIERKLTDQEVKRLSIKVSDNEIDQSIEQAKKAHLMSDAELRNALKTQGLTYDVYREQTKEQILRSKLINFEIKSKAVVTEDEIKTYYQKHPAEFGGQTQFLLRHILVAPNRMDARETMGTALKRIHQGDSFADLARMYSDSPSAVSGGQLGWIEKKTLAPVIQTALETLSKGETTEILDTDNGLQIFLIEDIKQIPPKPFDEVYEDIHKKLYAEILDKSFNSWVQGLRQQSHIKIIQ